MPVRLPCMSGGCSEVREQGQISALRMLTLGVIIVAFGKKKRAVSIYPRNEGYLCTEGQHPMTRC